MSHYARSLDPTVLGFGNLDMRVGDWVVHRHDVASHGGQPGVIAEIVPDANYGERTIRLDAAPGIPADTSVYRDSSLGDFYDSDYYLLFRPSAGRVAPSVTYRDFAPGDIVRRIDAGGHAHSQLRVVEPPSGFQLLCSVRTAPWTEDAQSGIKIISAHYLKLVWRHSNADPNPPVPRHRPPAPLDVGMHDAWPDLEFIKDVADWVESTARSGKSLGQLGLLLDKDSAYETIVPRRDELLNLARRFFAGCYGWYHTSRNADVALTFMSYPETGRDPHADICMALTQLFNAYSGPGTRCESCLREGHWAVMHGYQYTPRSDTNAPAHISPCPHVRCIRCDARAQEWCPTCASLYHARDYAADPPEHIRVCRSCCVHIECNCGSAACQKEVALEACICGKVGTCCQCVKCEKCGRGGGRDCCGRCAACCACDEQCMPNIPGGSGSHGMHPLHKFHAPRGEKGMARLLGAEIETAGCETFSPLLRAAVKKWKASIIHDGSLDCHFNELTDSEQSGMELVTQPAGGSMWVDMIADLGEGFAESKAYTDSSCGLHVHVDASDVGAYELSRLIRLYAHIEDPVYHMLPKEREGGDFSKRCGQNLLSKLGDATKIGRLSKSTLGYLHYGFPEATVRKGSQVYDPETGKYVRAGEPGSARLINGILKRKLDGVREDKYNSSRYVGLNLHSYWYRGTVEFRHHHGTNDPEKIRNWGIFVGSIVDFSVKKPEALLRKLLALPPREAVLALPLPDETKTWIQSRWDRFTKADDSGGWERRSVRRNSDTGET